MRITRCSVDGKANRNSYMQAKVENRSPPRVGSIFVFEAEIPVDTQVEPGDSVTTSTQIEHTDKEERTGTSIIMVQVK